MRVIVISNASINSVRSHCWPRLCFRCFCCWSALIILIQGQRCDAAGVKKKGRSKDNDASSRFRRINKIKKVESVGSKQYNEASTESSSRSNPDSTKSLPNSSSKDSYFRTKKQRKKTLASMLETKNNHQSVDHYSTKESSSKLSKQSSKLKGYSNPSSTSTNRSRGSRSKSSSSSKELLPQEEKDVSTLNPTTTLSAINTRISSSSPTDTPSSSSTKITAATTNYANTMIATSTAANTTATPPPSLLPTSMTTRITNSPSTFPPFSTSRPTTGTKVNNDESLCWNVIGTTMVGQGNEAFGHRVDLSDDGNLLAVTAARNMYLYRWKNETDWNLEYEFVDETPGSLMYISKDGSTAAVTRGSESALSVRMYRRRFDGIDDNDIAVWERMENANINREDADNSFGTTLAMSQNGNVIVIGDYGKNEHGTASLFMYDDLTTSWLYDVEFNGREEEMDNFGFAVDISREGTTVAVCGPQGGPGYCQVYRRRLLSDTATSSSNTVSNTSSWRQLGTDINGQFAFDDFGFRVSLSKDGNTVAISAVEHDVGDISDAGSVYIFMYDSMNDQWVQKGQTLNGTNKFGSFGQSIELSGDGTFVLVGSMTHWQNSMEAYAQAYAYSPDSGTWVELGQKMFNADIYWDRFGWSLGTTADFRKIAIGADTYGESPRSTGGSINGQVTTFELGIC